MSSHCNKIPTLLNNRACESFHLKQFDLSLYRLEQAESVLHKRYRPTSISEAILEHDNKRVYVEKSIDKNSYVFQRLVFDEGFSEFCEAELAQPDISTSVLKATISYNKAQIHIRHGNFDEAISCISLALHLLHEKQSSRIETLALSVMGQILYRQGRYEEAAQYYKIAIRRSKECNIECDHVISSALNSLSMLYYHMISNENKKRYLTLAQKYAERALKMRIQLHGNHHLAVATSYNNIGRLYAAQKRFHDAIKCYRKALDIRKQAGKDLDYAAVAFNAGKSFHQLQNLDSALEHYCCFLKIAVKHFTKKHRDVANALSEIAMIKQEKGHMEEALKLHKESLEIYQIILGNDHPETLLSYSRLGDFYFAQRNYDAALEAFQIGIKAETNINQRLISLFRMGEIYREKREYYHAIKSFKQVLSLQKICARQSRDIAITYHEIGVTYNKAGSHKDAVKYLRQAISCFGNSCLDATPAMVAISIILTKIGEYKAAMDLLKEAFSVRSRELGPDNKDVAFVMYNMGIIHEKIGSFSEAIALFKEVLRVEQLVLGKEHKDVVQTLLKLGQIFKESHDFDRALPYFLEALDIQRKLCETSQSQAIARTLIEVGDIHLAQGRVSSMMESFSDAERTYKKIFSASHICEQFYYLYRLSFSNGAPAA